MTILTSQEAQLHHREILQFLNDDGISLRSLIAHRCIVGTHEQLHVVVPTGRQVRSLHRAAVREFWNVNKKPLSAIPISTFDGLVQMVWNRQPLHKHAIHLRDAFRLVLFDEAVRICVKDETLTFFSKDKRSVSAAVIERLADVIYGLRRKGISVEDIEQDIHEQTRNPNNEIEPNRLRDIATIYKKYNELRGDNLYDPPAIIESVTNILLSESTEIQNHSTDALYVIQGFSEFTIPEQEFLCALAHRCFPLCIVFDFTRDNGPLFGNVDDTISRLLQAGFEEMSLPQLNASNLSGVNYIKRWLFNTEKDIRNAEFDESLRVLPCKNIRDEVHTILQYVKYQIVKNDVPPDSIAIVSRSPERYASLFREYGDEYSIPLNITDRYTLNTSPVITGIFAVLNIIAYDYRLPDVHRALNNSFITFRHADGAPIDAVALYDVAVELRIRSRYIHNASSQWLQTFERYIQNQKRYINTIAQDGLTSEDDVIMLRRSLTRIEHAYSDFQRIHSYLSVPKRKQDVSVFTRFIKQSILNGLGVRSTLESLTLRIQKNDVPELLTKETVERDTRAFAEFVRILDEVEYIITQRNNNEPLHFEEYLRHLNSAVRGSRYQVKENSGAGVLVTSLDQIRGIPHSHIIICGLNDGVFPMAYTPETFLGRELPDSEQRHIQAERMLFFSALTNNPDALHIPNHLLLTYPTFSMNGEDLVVSPFIENIQKITSPLQPSMGARKVKDTTELRSLVRAVDNSVIVLADDESHSKRRDYIWCKDWICAECSPTDLLLHSTSTVAHHSIVPKEVADRRIRYQEQLQAESLYSAIPPNQIMATALKSHSETAFSVSRLEQYASCPYKYFVNTLLGVKEERSNSQALNSLEKGNLLHTILYRFFMRLRAEHNVNSIPSIHDNPVQLDAARRSEYLALLRTLTLEECNRIPFEHPFYDLDKDILLGTSRHTGILEYWLNAELKRIEEGWDFRPVLFEYGFGMRAKHVESHPVQLDGFLLRGKIDRIEKKTNHDGTLSYLIADYKLRSTGTASIQELLKGEKFQMPLYISAFGILSQHLTTQELIPEGSVYYIFDTRAKSSHTLLAAPEDSSIAKSRMNSRGNYPRSEVLNMGELPSLLKTSESLATSIVMNITQGNFPAKPLSDACTYCSYSSICRINEQLKMETQREDESELDE